MTDATGTTSPPGFALGEHEAVYRQAVDRARDESWAERLFARDTTLWSTDPRVQAAIADRLGWLDAPGSLRRPGRRPRGVRRRDPRRGVHDGDRRRDGRQQPRPGGPRPDVRQRPRAGSDLRVLDSTDPAAVAAIVDDLDPLATLFIVASKSGTTTEPLAFQADAWDRIEKALRSRHAPRNEHAGELMIAITDPGKSVEAIPHHDELRETFLNPPDIGGRYSALTYVGLVPASPHRARPRRAARVGRRDARRLPEPEPTANPGVSLGLALGVLAKAGRDKLTFLADPDIATFGAWAEQLIAESTGKRGVGIVPVDRRAARRADRLRPRPGLRPAVSRRLARASTSTEADALADALEGAGHPVIRIALADPIDIGAEFFRWEVATAIAGAVLGIDPFDQPNVEEAKERTRALLERHADGRDRRATDAAAATPHRDVRRAGPLRRRAAPAQRRAATRRSPASCAVISPAAARTPISRSRRSSPRRPPATRRSPGSASFSARRPAAPRPPGYGPRFLHSTGQLHKGGAPIGWFLQLTSDHPVDRPIPGWPYTFGQLIDAQAQGDFEAIESHDLPIVRVHLTDPEADLATLEAALAEALALRPDDATRPNDQQPDREAQRMQIGFVGLGRMGANMVRRLLRDGHEVVAYNRTPEKTKEIAGEGAIAAFSIEELVSKLNGAARRLDHGPGRRRDGSPDRRAARAPRAGRHDHRRRQHELPRRPAPPRRARGEGDRYVDAGTSGGIWGLQVGYCLMVGGDSEAVAAARADLHVAGARRRLPPCRRPGCRALREDGPQRHRVRPDAGLRRGLRDHARVRRTRSTSRRSPSCGCRARSSGRGCSSLPRGRSRRTARTSSTSRATSPTPARAAGRSRRRSTTTSPRRSSRCRC